MRASLCLLSCLLLSIVACGDDDGADGTSPTIDDLQYTPRTVPVGQTTTVSGSFAFVDEDANVTLLGLELVLPSGARQALGTVAINGAQGVPSSTATFQLNIQPPSAGAYGFEVWLVDADGNASNRLAGGLTAQ